MLYGKLCIDQGFGQLDKSHIVRSQYTKIVFLTLIF